MGFHLSLLVQGVLQALGHGFVHLHAGGDGPEILRQLLCPAFGEPQAALQVLPVLI